MPSERAIETRNVRFFGLMIGKIEVLTPKSDRLLVYILDMIAALARLL